MKKVVCSLLIMFILFSEFTACFGATNEVVLSNDVEVDEKKSTEENIDSKNLVENETEMVSNEIKDEEKIENTIDDGKNKFDSDMDKDSLEIDEVKDENNKKIEENDEKSNEGSYKDEDSDAYSNENTDAVVQSIQTQSVGESDKRLVEIDGVWRMVIDDKIVYDYTGIGKNENGMWYMENGEISYKYIGTWFEGEEAYAIKNGCVIAVISKDFTGLMWLDDWRMIINGKIDYNYTGIGTNKNGTWYLEEGKITYNYSGTYYDGKKTYIIKNSGVIKEISEDFTGLMWLDDWRMVINGKVDYEYTGLGENENGIWYLEDGKITYNYTGTYYENDKAYIIKENSLIAVVSKEFTGLMWLDDWRMVINGKVDYEYTGLGENKNGIWYLENGKITYTYTGEYEDEDGTVYKIEESRFAGVIGRQGYFGKMSLEQPVQGSKYISDSLIVSGWALSSELNDKILVYIDGKYIGEASRENRQDILDEYSEEFENMYNTELPGYVYDLTGYGLPVGYHIIRIEDVTADGGVVMQSREIGFTITALSKSYGIDVSHYQGEIDWETVKNSGVTFAILKIGEYWTNSKRIVYDQFFEKNYQACKRLGIAVGGYFYSYAFNRDEGNEEADICLSLIKNKIFELPIFIDVEDKAIKNAVANGKTDVANVTDASLAFCEKIVSAGHQAGVYASRDFFYNYFNIPLIEKYWIWVAHYTSDQTNYTGKYNFWQATSEGSVPGINGNVDIDWFYKR